MEFLPENSFLKEKGNKNVHCSGQALLIVLLAMSVVMTVVLSVVSRSITDISVTTYEEESQRAFDAAEAGIEETLISGLAPADEINIGDASFKVKQDYPTPVDDQFKYPPDLFSGESATFWFVSQDDLGNLTCDGKPCFDGGAIKNIGWGKSGSPETPAVEISIFYDDTLTAAFTIPNDLSNVKILRYALDPLEPARGNNFDPSKGSCKIAGHKFPYSTGNINLVPVLGDPCAKNPGCILMVKVRMFYNSSDPQPVAINSNLPSQGKSIKSTGMAGESTRKIEVFQSYPETPFVFDAAVFSPGGLVHN